MSSSSEESSLPLIFLLRLRRLSLNSCSSSGWVQFVLQSVSYSSSSR